VPARTVVFTDDFAPVEEITRRMLTDTHLSFRDGL
jgi:hypothetical protein